MIHLQSRQRYRCKTTRILHDDMEQKIQQLLDDNKAGLFDCKHALADSRKAKLIYCSVGIIVFVFLPSLIFMYTENWSFVTSLYFSDTGLNTIYCIVYSVYSVYIRS